MRLILAVTLATGLLLVGLTVYNAQQVPGGTVNLSAMEDGTGFPPPHPAK